MVHTLIVNLKVGIEFGEWCAKPLLFVGQVRSPDAFAADKFEIVAIEIPDGHEGHFAVFLALGSHR